MNKLASTLTGLQHIGIPTEDLAASRSFYEELGFTLIHEKVIRDGKQHVNFLKLHDLVLEIYEDPAALKAGAIDHLALNCTDLEKAFQLALEKGYTILSDGIEELPFFENGVRFFIIQGPNKERVEFNQYL